MLKRISQTAALVAAYKAKVLASALWVSGLELDCERAPEVSAESNRLLRGSYPYWRSQKAPSIGSRPGSPRSMTG